MTGMIKPLDETGGCSEALLGGKALNLGKLIKAGFPVPSGFCLTSDAYRRHADGCRIDLARMAPEEIRGRLMEGQIPAAVMNQLAAAYRGLVAGGLGPRHLAVRSSAVGEDAPGRSFAGLYETVLDVDGEQELIAAVKRCWASLWSERACAYRKRFSLKASAAVMAVVVQMMIEAEAAGVAFTVDPLANAADRLRINAVRGSGEKLAAGRIIPDEIAVDRMTLAVKRLGPPSVGRSSLSRGQLRKLAALALRVESLFGTPQDIEWAYRKGSFHILQARPAAPVKKKAAPVVIWGHPANHRLAETGVVFWSNWNTRENMPYPLKPMAWSFLNDAMFPAIFRVLWGTREKSALYPYSFVIDLVNGRAYWNMNRLLGHPFFGWLIRPVLKFIDSQAAGTFRDLARSGQFKPDRPPVAFWRRWREGAVAALVWLRFPWFAGRGRIERQCERFWRRAESFEAQDLAGRPVSELIAAVRGFGLDAARTAFPMMIVAGKALLGLGIISRLIRRWPELRAEDLLAGIPGNKTTEGALELYGLSRMPSRLKTFFHSTPAAKLEAGLAKSSQGREYLQRLEEFLSRHGHRGIKDLDIGFPSWRENRTYVLQMIQGFLQPGAGNRDPERLFAAAAERRLALTDEVERRLGGGFWGRIIPFREALFHAGLKVAHEYFPLRENEKYYGLKCYPGSRRIILEIGQRYRQAGWLTKAEDIFFITFPEIEKTEALGGDAARGLRSLVRQRRVQWQKQVGGRSPFIVRSDGRRVPAGEGAAPPPGRRLAGLAVAPGKVSGIARIIFEPGQAGRFRQGEILVAPYAEPGWAPLFLLARGLVLEVGGTMCHGAIIAREFGIPAVVGVKNAMGRIRDGERITVDGDAGLVWPERG